MHRFEASLRTRFLWLVVAGPPLLFWSAVQFLAHLAGDGPMNVREVFFLVALAQALPLGALAWILGSVCAYTILPGRIIVHRVVSDREFPLEPATEVSRLATGAIAVRLPGRTLRLRVFDAERCLRQLRNAVDAA